MKKMLLMLLLGALSACDYVEKQEFNRERSDRTYRAAMEEYRAGRLEASMVGLEKVCAQDPANTSARFQLACLLQDFKKDYLSAYCAYHEYLIQAPTSDKARLARERLAVCEREMTKGLASQYGLNTAEDGERAALAVQEKLTQTEKRVQKLTKDLEAAMQRAVALRAENERLKNYLHSTASTASSDPREVGDSDVREAIALLDEADAATQAETVSDELKNAAKELLSDATEEAPLLVQPATAKTERDQQRQAERDAQAAAAAAAEAKPKRPDSYVVQEGDTLYKIALRFYGRSSAWSRIREANKATISTDGRVRTGQKIILPAE